MTLRAPAFKQSLEHRLQPHALKFGVQCVNLVLFDLLGPCEQVQVHVVNRDAVDADQFIQRRQGGRELGRAEHGAVGGNWQERVGASGVGRERKTQRLFGNRCGLAP